MEQKTDSKLGKEYVKAVYCHPAYLTYMQSMSCKMLGWMNHKLKSRLPTEISTTYQHTRLMNSQNSLLEHALLPPNNTPNLIKVQNTIKDEMQSILRTTWGRKNTARVCLKRIYNPSSSQRHEKVSFLVLIKYSISQNFDEGNIIWALLRNKECEQADHTW